MPAPSPSEETDLADLLSGLPADPTDWDLEDCLRVATRLNHGSGAITQAEAALMFALSFVCCGEPGEKRLHSLLADSDAVQFAWIAMAYVAALRAQLGKPQIYEDIRLTWFDGDVFDDEGAGGGWTGAESRWKLLDRMMEAADVCPSCGLPTLDCQEAHDSY